MPQKMPTPGPWIPNTQLNTVGARDRKGRLEHVCGAVHNHADLRLIVASPDLLDAVKNLCNVFGFGLDPDKNECQYRSIANAKAAIDKAEAA
jgi:hypothetical protein